MFMMWSWKAPSGSRNIDARLVNSWYERRATTGFPEVAERVSEGYRPVRYWDLYGAMLWYLTWEPRSAGAPRGNRNAEKHGRYVGLRAEQEQRGREAE